MQSKTIELTDKNKFSTLAEAVAVVKPDFSYNPASAAEKIKNLDSGCKYYTGTELAIVDGGEIYTVYTTFDGIRILAKFEPFFSCMSDTPFQMAILTMNKLEITTTRIKKSMRKAVSDASKACEHLCFIG